MNLLSPENYFLFMLAIIWIIGAILQDLKRREVDNVWNFSLIAIALSYRAIVSVNSGNIWFLLNGIIGFFVFLILGNLFYYSRIFAGGDAKLVIALGAVLPFSFSWLVNIKIFGLFILMFLVFGSIYALIWSLVLITFNLKGFRKEFSRQFKKYYKMFYFSLGFLILSLIFALIFKSILIFLLGIVILFFPILFIFSKSVEESSMIKSLNPTQVTEGDWLYEDLRVNGKTIKSNWEGVTKKELDLIRAYHKGKVLVKQGIPFTPAFLFSFVALLILFWKMSWIF